MSGFEFNIDEEENEFSFDGPWTGRDATLFLIDSSPRMFEPNEDDEDVHFIKSLRCVHSTVSRKIIGNDQDLYGIVLFNTLKDKNNQGFLHIYILQDIDRPGAERMLHLEELLEDCSGKTAKGKYGSCNGADIHEVLWACRNTFISSKKSVLTKNVLLFTCEDDPHADDEHKRRQAMKGAKDLKEGFVELEILPLGSSFSPHKFYKELLTQGDDDEEVSSVSVLSNPIDRFEKLLERVRRLEHKQRSSGKVPFSLAPGLEMGVKIFTYIRPIYKTKLKLYKVTNEEVVSQRTEVLESTGAVLMPSDFVKFKEYGGRKIKFSSDEVRSLSSVYEPRIELLGFKPFSVFKPFLYLKPANFIYPDEKSIKGSTKLFACLLERCLVHSVCPVVRVVPREGGSVSWAFLLPQPEVKDEEACQEKPPGFYVCYLPFADDFRSVELRKRPRANGEQVEAAMNVMRKLHFKYHPDCFENPEIQTHWRNVEALALNRHYLEPVKDYTVPDYERISAKAGALIERFKEVVLSDSYDPDAVSKKRPPPSATSRSTAPKRQRVEPSAKEAADVEDMARQKKVNKLTVDALRLWLTDRGVRVYGKKKAQLVQDVYDELNIEV